MTNNRGAELKSATARGFHAFSFAQSPFHVHSAKRLAYNRDISPRGANQWTQGRSCDYQIDNQVFFSHRAPRAWSSVIHSPHSTASQPYFCVC